MCALVYKALQPPDRDVDSPTSNKSDRYSFGTVTRCVQNIYMQSYTHLTSLLSRMYTGDIYKVVVTMAADSLYLVSLAIC